MHYVIIVLQNGMQPLFHDVKVDIGRCPYLTTTPYNLGGVGIKELRNYKAFNFSLNGVFLKYE